MARDTVVATPDSVYHVNMKFVGEEANQKTEPEAFEITTERHNYYLGHCSDGILNVAGYKRVVYKDIYPGIDFHVYSNPWGPKFYIVINPGADPDDIQLKFTGQESIDIDFSGWLKLNIADKYIKLPEALAYQEIGGTTSLVSWGLGYEELIDDQIATFNFDTYDPAYPLILDLSVSLPAADPEPSCPIWSSYFGDTDDDRPSEMATLSNGDVLVCGYTFSPMFPATVGAYDESFNGTQDAYWSKFNNQYSHNYTTFYGGSSADQGSSIAVSADELSVYLFGHTNSTDIGTYAYSGSAFLDDDPEPNNCFVARFSLVPGSVGEQEWRTYFGADVLGCTCVRTDEEDNVYLAGHAGILGDITLQTTCAGSSGTFPVCNAIGGGCYYQNFYAGGNTDAFFCKFNADLDLVHSTLFGGYNSDQAYGMAVDDVRNEIYLVGNTSSKRYTYTNCAPPTSPNYGFPLCSVPGGYFDQNLNATNTDALNDGYLACFSTTDGTLHYSSFIAGDADELGLDVAVNQTDGKVYMSGFTTATTYSSTTCAAPVGAGFPNCASGTQFHPAFGGGAYDAYVVKLDAVTRTLNWTSFIGGGGMDGSASLSVDDLGQLVFSGWTESGSAGTATIPVLQQPLYYYQPDHADNGSGTAMRDGMVFVFNGLDEEQMGTYYGGLGNDGCADAQRVGLDRMYIAGNARSTANFPFACPITINPWCYLVYTTVSPTAAEAFYAQIQCDGYTGMEDQDDGSDAQQPIFWLNAENNEVTLQFSLAPVDGSARLSMWDPTGRLVRDRLAPITREGKKITYSIGRLTAGIYLLQVSAAGEGALAIGKIAIR